MMNRVKSPVEQERLRTSGRMLAAVLDVLSRQLEPGQTTGFLGDLAAKELARLGGKPAFLGYKTDPRVRPFPAVICISVNDEVVHGIPGRREIATGDVVKLDFGVNFEGMITDGAVTVAAGGEATPAVARLLTATREALELGVAQVRPGGRVGDISAAVERRLRRDKLAVVEDLCGHGVGDEVHEDPLILNYGRAGSGPKLKAGMSIAIEPIATLGRKAVGITADGWTIKTMDESLAAQFEHTVLVTEDGFEIVTTL